MGCMTFKENNSKQKKSKDQSRTAVENNADFAVPLSEYSPPRYSSSYLGLHNRKYPDLSSSGARRGSYRVSDFTSPPPLDDDDEEAYDDLDLDLEDDENETVSSSSVLKVDHSEFGVLKQKNDTEGTEEIENCYIEIEEDTGEVDEERPIQEDSARSLVIEDYGRIEIQEDSNSHGGDHGAQSRRNDKNQKVVLAIEWMFVIANFVLEVISTVLDQLSSAHKPLYSLLGMLFSYGAMFICVVELVYKARKEKVNWRWKGVVLPWFYNPTSELPFGTFKDLTGFACAFCQCIATSINYAYYVQKPIKISVWPIIFAFGLLCSKVL